MIEAFLDAFLAEAIEAHGLSFGGGGKEEIEGKVHDLWSGIRYRGAQADIDAVA